MAGGKKSRLASRPKPKEVDEETKRRAAALPEEFDWRNVDGVNYVSPVRDQGSCGSCYIFSSMALLEARLRIATNNSERTVFSTQEVVDCSRYSQGCDGGFPYLIGGKYAQDYGVIDDACYPYTATAQQCKSPSSHASTQCRKRTYAAKYNY
ncbi:PREDICTED: dipeptidyl peptidase 1-like, partial [Rhagoletis zephyria]|uniref:dipeptidyl peptidase 1-like n=1 Tax=Rhagoletis zephyria TaxID=28612 RepID=UPI0008113EB5